MDFNFLLINLWNLSSFLSQKFLNDWKLNFIELLTSNDNFRLIARIKFETWFPIICETNQIRNDLEAIELDKWSLDRWLDSMFCNLAMFYDIEKISKLFIL